MPSPRVLARFFPAALKPASVFGSQGVAPGAFVHATAVLEAGVTVDPGAVVGPGAEIGAGTVIASHAVIGPQVRIGRDCAIGAGSTLQSALIGNRVIIHPGVRIGQDGFGFAMSPKGHMKVPQIGRVIIQDDVEIGANSCIDRGASRDTVIGEGTKIDNLVQIGHNVVIGRHCVIVSQVGIAGSTTLEDFVVLGGQVGLAGHLDGRHGRAGRGPERRRRRYPARSPLWRLPGAAGAELGARNRPAEDAGREARQGLAAPSRSADRRPAVLCRRRRSGTGALLACGRDVDRTNGLRRPVDGAQGRERQ